jgi:hypothetical protein
MFMIDFLRNPNICIIYAIGALVKCHLAKEDTSMRPHQVQRLQTRKARWKLRGSFELFTLQRVYAP